MYTRSYEMVQELLLTDIVDIDSSVSVVVSKSWCLQADDTPFDSSLRSSSRTTFSITTSAVSSCLSRVNTLARWTC